MKTKICQFFMLFIIAFIVLFKSSLVYFSKAYHFLNIDVCTLFEYSKTWMGHLCSTASTSVTGMDREKLRHTHS